MNNAIEITTHITPWGATARLVAAMVANEIVAINTPPPFETQIQKPDLEALARRIQAICDNATKSKRVGMMISSRFRVYQDEAAVSIWHVRNEKNERRFISLILT